MKNGRICVGVCGPLSGPGSSLGREMKQAIDLAIQEKNATGGICGHEIEVLAFDDEGRVGKAEAVATELCKNGNVIGVIGHYSSDTSLQAAKIYEKHAISLVAPIASNPYLTESGLTNVLRYTNRDDRTAEAISDYLYHEHGKRKAIVVLTDTAYGNSMAGEFAKAFSRLGGCIIETIVVKEGQKDFVALVKRMPGDFDLLFYGGTFEGAPLLKAFRGAGYEQLMATGDGCWDIENFLTPAREVIEAGEGVLVLSASAAIGDVDGSTAFATAYQRKYGNIINYALNSYDCARILLAAIEAAVGAGNPTKREEVGMALRKVHLKGLANGNMTMWDRKGDNMAAITKLNTVRGGVFKEVCSVPALAL